MSILDNTPLMVAILVTIAIAALFGLSIAFSGHVQF